MNSSERVGAIHGHGDVAANAGKVRVLPGLHSSGKVYRSLPFGHDLSQLGGVPRRAGWRRGDAASTGRLVTTPESKASIVPSPLGPML